MGKEWIAHWGLVLALGGSVHACRSSQTVADTAGGGALARAGPQCLPGHAGCPCSTDGAVVNCGTTAGRHGDYVACVLGRSACEAGHWGPCVGSTLVTKSLARATIGAGGLHTLSTTIQCPSGAPECADPCDPNVYTVTENGGSDVDAAGFTTINEGGVTLTPACQGLGCQVAPDCPSGSATTLTGTVYDPAGVNPVYNATVYVPIDGSALDPIPSGAACGACASVPAVNALAMAQTGPDGKFVLTNVPTTDVAPGNPIPLVVQVGKWRREEMLTSVPRCQTTPVDKDSSRLPRNQLDGAGAHADLPKMAISAGRDPLECLLLKMGVDPSEFHSAGTGAGSIDYYVNSTGVDPSLVGSLPDGGPPPLMNYDAVLLPCEGKEDDGNNQFADNVAAYANAGGRLLTTHFGYTWLATPTNSTANSTNPITHNTNPFYGVANWSLNSPAFYANAAIATMLPDGQPFPKGQALATWAFNVHASSTLGSLTIGQAHADETSLNLPATAWIQEPAPGVRPYFFSFDTPVSGGSSGGGGTCGRVDYSEFHVPATALVDQAAAGQCSSNLDCGFTATCIPGTVGTCTPQGCTTSADCGGSSNYQCVSGAPGACIPLGCTVPTDCVSQQCVQGKCGCTENSQCATNNCMGGECVPPTQGCDSDAECGSVEDCSGAVIGTCQGSCTKNADCTNGERCMSGLCQKGCNDFLDCPSRVCNTATPSKCSAASNSFPLMCKQGPMSPEEAALEFMLLDLTTCISPDSVPPPLPPTSDAGTMDTGVSEAGVTEAGSAPPNYADATFTEDFTSTCPLSTHAVWREVDWDATVPNTASIDFSAQTADLPADGGPPSFSGMPIPLGTATTSSVPPGGKAYIDTGITDGGTAGGDAGLAGAFDTANPPVLSRDALRLIVTLHPTSDGLSAPTLLDWQVKADCLPSE
jgi:hypothetical protein